MENYLAGVGVQPLGCFELPVQVVFPLRTLKRELQRRIGPAIRVHSRLFVVHKHKMP